MLGTQDNRLNYDCGGGGASPRVRPIPMSCPTAFPLWWEKFERFWEDSAMRRDNWRPPVPEA